MDRLVSFDYAADIRMAQDQLPVRIRDMVACDFLTGVDPLFAGLHNFKAASYGRSLSNTAHCAYVHNQERLPRSQRATTVVLPAPVPWWTIVHELGHVLHERVGFGFVADPVSAYARTDRYEAFAEAFTAWIIPRWELGRPDDKTVALFELLADER